MKTLIKYTVMVAILAALVPLTQAKDLKPQTKCPVMGKAINKKAFIDVGGERFYVCCKGCTKKIAKDPAAARAKLAAAGEAPEIVQKKCAVMGGKIKSNQYAEVDGGKRVFVCCKGCIAKIKKDPAKYLAKVAADIKGGMTMKKGGHMDHSGHKH